MTLRFDAICLLAVWVWVWWLPLDLQAQVQAQTQNPSSAFLEILNIDAQQFPQVAVTVSAATGVGDIREQTPTLWENNQLQRPISDEIQQLGLEVMLVINAEQIAAVDGSGQSIYDAIVNVVLAMVGQNTVIRQQDRLAAYGIDETGALTTIQGWTDEPNLIFNQIVQNRPATVTVERPIADGLQLALAQFPMTATPQAARSLILFSVGTAIASVEEMESVITNANARDVHIHVVEWDAAGQPVQGNQMLQQLVERTHGLYLALQAPVPSTAPSPSQLPLLWEHLAAQRFQRLLTYQSGAVSLETIAVELELLDGTLLTDSRSLSDLALRAPQERNAVGQERVTIMTIPTVAVPTVAAVAEALTSNEEARVPQDADHVSRLSIPGTSLSLPYGTAIAVITLLLLLLIYLLYEEIQQQRLRSAAAAHDGGEEAAPFQEVDMIYQLMSLNPDVQEQEYQENHLLPYQNGFAPTAAPQFDRQDGTDNNHHPDLDEVPLNPLLEKQYAAAEGERLVEVEGLPEHRQSRNIALAEEAAHFDVVKITYL